MAEPTAATVSEAAAPERDVLLATKLNMPRPGPGLVPRPRLAQRLDDGLRQGLVLVCAPAGYGKTALLADWARNGEHPAAWLLADAGDNDPARFWRHAVAALDRARPGIAEAGRTACSARRTPASFPGAVLVNELAAGHRWGGPWRVRGQLAELRAAELRFTAGEAAALLEQVAGAQSGPCRITMWRRWRRGPRAGPGCSLLACHCAASPTSPAGSIHRRHRYVLDFLAEEVLERQSVEVRTFLLETSVLERLSGSLCDAVTGRSRQPGAAGAGGAGGPVPGAAG